MPFELQEVDSAGDVVATYVSSDNKIAVLVCSIDRDACWLALLPPKTRASFLLPTASISFYCRRYEQLASYTIAYHAGLLPTRVLFYIYHSRITTSTGVPTDTPSRSPPAKPPPSPRSPALPSPSSCRPGTRTL
jgi:hypothetical protein